jgi:DNA-binding MarR family transcriptional regulator
VRDAGTGTRSDPGPELGLDDQAYQAAVHDFDAAAAAVLEINLTDLRCLEILLRQETALPGRLGAALGLTTGSVTAMLDRLEALGYLTRTRDAADRRKVIVRPTPLATQRVWDEIYRPLSEEGLAAIAHYSAAERAIVRDYLRRGRELYERRLTQLRDRPAP